MNSNGEVNGNLSVFLAMAQEKRSLEQMRRRQQRRQQAAITTNAAAGLQMVQPPLQCLRSKAAAKTPLELQQKLPCPLRNANTHSSIARLLWVHLCVSITIAMLTNCSLKANFCHWLLAKK